ncbi:MAG: cache domain-containing protein, partial [Paenibacillus macerans]
MRLWKSAKQLLRGFHIRNIQTLISFSSIIVTVLTVVLVSTLLYNRFTRAAEKNVELSLEEIVEQVNSNLELYVSGMQDVFELTEHKIASTPEAASDERLGNELGTVLNTREDLVSIALFTEEGKLVRNVPEIPMRQNTRLQEQLWFESAMENPGKLQFTPPHIQNLFKWEYRWVVSMSKT